MSFESLNSSFAYNIFVLFVFSFVLLLTYTYYIGFNDGSSSIRNDFIESGHFSSKKFTLVSDRFEHMGYLPNNYTCGGESKSPPLSWFNEPENTKSFVITMSSFWSNKYDSGIKYDWLVYNISSDLHYLEEDVGNTTRKGIWNGIIHGGTYPNKPHYYYVAPCSEGWGIRYYTFTIYALNQNIVSYVTDDDTYQLFVANNMVNFIYDNNFVIASANVTVGWQRFEVPDDYIPPADPPPDVIDTPRDSPTPNDETPDLSSPSDNVGYKENI